MTGRGTGRIGRTGNIKYDVELSNREGVETEQREDLGIKEKEGSWASKMEEVCESLESREVDFFSPLSSGCPLLLVTPPRPKVPLSPNLV